MCALDELYTDDSKDNYVMEKVIKYSTTILKQLPQKVNKKLSLQILSPNQGFENQVKLQDDTRIVHKTGRVIRIKEHSSR